MRFLPSLFETKHADSSGAVSRAVQVSPNGFYSSGVTQGFQTGAWDFHQSINKGYEKLITIFRCVDAIAQNAASLEQFVSKGSARNGLRVEDPYIEHLLNRRSNIYETAWMFRYRLSSQLLLSRKGVFVERVNNRQGRPVQLHLMDPANVTPIKDPRIYVSGYKVRGADNKQYTLDPDQVIWIRLKPHPSDPYAQMTPMVAAGLTADTEYLSRIYNRNVVGNNGRPGMLITIGGGNNGISREDAEELKRVFGGTPNAAGETHVVEADNMNVQDLQATPSELQYLAGLEATANDIYLAFGTPKSVLGDASGRCLDEDELVRLADGRRVRAGDLVGTKFKLLTSTPNGQVEVKAWATKEKIEDVFLVTTESGRQLRVNGRHPLFAATYTRSKDTGVRRDGPRIDVDGWTPVSALQARIQDKTMLLAVPSAFRATTTGLLTEDEATVLGYLVGDGSMSAVRGHIALTTPDGPMVKDFIRAVEALGDEVTRYQTGDRVATWGVRAKQLSHQRDEHGHCHCDPCKDRANENARCLSAGLPSLAKPGRPESGVVRALLKRTALHGTTSHTKFIPDEVFAASSQAQAAFLGGLYASDGHCSVKENGGEVELATVSHRLALDVQELLLRFGISARIRQTVTQGGPGHRDKRGVGYKVIINDAENVVRFTETFEVAGKDRQIHHTRKAALKQLERKSGGGNVHTWRTKHLTPDLRWERIKSIESAGVKQTIGIAVPKYHTYLSTFYEHNTFDNAFAERLNWWMDTMQAHCDGVSSAWDVLTEGGIEDDLFVSNNYDQVDVLQKAKQDKNDRLLNDFNSGVISLDEYLRGTGRIPLDVPASRVLYITAPGKLPVGKNEQDAQTVIEMLGQLAIPGPTPAGQGNGFGPQQMSEYAKQGALAGAQQAQRAIANDTAARALAIAGKALDIISGIQTKAIEGTPREYNDDEDDDQRDWDEIEVPNDSGTKTVVLVQTKDYPYTELRTSVEAEMHGLLTAWNNRQATVVSERLMGTKARKGTRHWDGEGVGTKSLDTSYLVDSNKWADEIASDFRPTLEKVVDRQITRTLKQLNKDGVISEYNAQGGGNPSATTMGERLFGASRLTQDAVKRAMVDQVMGIVRESAKNQSDRLAVKIQKMDNDGASVDQIKDTIYNHTSKRAPWKKSLATYATTALIEGAQDAVLDPVGDLIDRQWNSHHDEHTRFTHLEADGQVVQGKQMFEVGDAQMMYPCDPMAPINETAGCRCWSTFQPHQEHDQ